MATVIGKQLELTPSSTSLVSMCVLHLMSSLRSLHSRSTIQVGFLFVCLSFVLLPLRRMVTHHRKLCNHLNVNFFFSFFFFHLELSLVMGPLECHTPTFQDANIVASSCCRGPPCTPPAVGNQIRA